MKVNLFITARDGQDGSFSIMFHNTKEEELEKGSLYDDGVIKEVILEFDTDGKLVSNNFIDFE